MLIADGWFVGRLGTAELAALALVFPAQTTLQMMSAGAMGGGVASSVARALGSGDRGRAEDAAAHALAIAAVMTVLFAVVFVGFGRPLFGALGGSGAALEGAVAFSTVMFLGCGAHWLANTLASILRGTGDMHSPGRGADRHGDPADPVVRRAHPRLGRPAASSASQDRPRPR